jgi:mannose-1-phosphate guanylyltransferase/mannose-6-phosphate isomerase
LSTDERPKQFQSLGSEFSLLQETVRRLRDTADLAFEPPMLVCNRRHADLAEGQMAAVGHRPGTVVLEPFGRNTAAVAMAAALLTQERDPGALILMMPSDHVMAAPEAFIEAVAEAAPAARDQFVLFGVTPSSPETGYGYIETNGALDGRLRRVARFVEKPDLATACAYLASGRYLWNSGIFMFSPRILIEEMERFAPQVATAIRAAVGSKGNKRVVELAAEALAPCPSISLDYAVMEHTDRAIVLPLNVGWADVGSWSSIWEYAERDASGNVLRGVVESLECEDCLIWSEGGTVAAVGLKDLVIVQVDNTVVVTPKSRAQDVKLLVERLKAGKVS